MGKLLSLSSKGIFGMLDRTRKAAGIPRLTFRQCRTTWATLYEADGKDRQAILGHHSEQFTMAVYRKPIVERQQTSIEELESRLSRKAVKIHEEGKRMNCPIRPKRALTAKKLRSFACIPGYKRKGRRRTREVNFRENRSCLARPDRGLV
jgi:hypothetical protein